MRNVSRQFHLGILVIRLDRCTHEDFYSRIEDARARLHDCVERFRHGRYNVPFFILFDSCIIRCFLMFYAKFVQFRRSNG